MTEVTQKNIDATLATTKFVLLEFWAPWDKPGTVMRLIMEDVGRDYKDLTLGSVNVDVNEGLAIKFGVRSLPVLVLFKDADPTDRRVGILPKAVLKTWLGMHLS